MNDLRFLELLLDPFVTFTEAARLAAALSASRRTLERESKRRRLHPVRIGRAARPRESELQRHREQRDR